MKPLFAAIALVLLPACTSSSLGAPNTTAALQAISQAHRAHRNVTVSNVYVATYQVGVGSHAGGKDALLRFTAGVNTSAPNEEVDPDWNPSFGTVSPYNGRFAIADSNSPAKVHVFDKDLGTLYDFTPPHGTRSNPGFPVSLAYDYNGNLWVGVWLGSGNGEVFEYNDSDTTPDHHYFVPSNSAADAPFSISFDPNDNLYIQAAQVLKVYIYCNTSGCHDTGIPSYSDFINEYYGFLARTAIIGSGSAPEFVESKSNNTIRYYVAPVSGVGGGGVGGTWTFDHDSSRCTGLTGMTIADVESDQNSVLYLTCLIPDNGTGSGSGNATESTVVELNTDGTKYSITGLTNPASAGAY